MDSQDEQDLQISLGRKIAAERPTLQGRATGTNQKRQQTQHLSHRLHQERHRSPKRRLQRYRLTWHRRPNQRNPQPPAPAPAIDSRPEQPGRIPPQSVRRSLRETFLDGPESQHDPYAYRRCGDRMGLR